MVDQNFLTYLRSDPTFADKSDLELIRLTYPEMGFADDGQTPVSDRELVNRLGSQAGISPEQFETLGKNLGVEKTGLMDG